MALRLLNGSGPLRDIDSVLDPAFGAVADFNMTGTTVTISGGSLNTGTLSATEATLTKGKTMIINGLTAPVVVQSVSGTTVTFTGNASGAVSGAMCAWGTDNTTALNAHVAHLLATERMGIWPSGKMLITGTVGHADDSTGYQSLSILCGGAAVNTARLKNLATNGGTSLVWGGVAGGTMLSLNRVAFPRLIGGLSLVGQPSYDPSSVFTTFGNRAGIGYLLAQTSTPLTGTGYGYWDDLVVGELDLGVQFAVNQNDNNCDTTTFGRLIAWRCNQIALMSGGQQTTYAFGHVESTSTGRGIVLNGGGSADIRLMHLSGCTPTASRTDAGATATNGGSVVTDSACVASDAGRLVTGSNVPAACYVGTVTPGVSFTTVIAPGSATPATMTGAVSGVTLGQVFTGVEAHSSVSGANTHVGLIRIEQTTSGVVYAGPGSQVNIDSFEEISTSPANLNLFTVDGGSGFGGMLRIGQMSMYSHNATANATNSPFYIGAGSSTSGSLVVDQAMWSGAGGQIGNLNNWIFANNNAYADITVRVLRDAASNVYNPINTRLQRGPCYLYATTTDATTTTTLTQAGLAVAQVFSYGPQIPKGYGTIRVYVIGDRGDGTFTTFLRYLVCSRTSGAATVNVYTPPWWADEVNATDQLVTVAVTANQIIQIQVKGTAATTINWQATVAMEGFTADVAL